MDMTFDSVLALAPDVSSVKAAHGLVAPGKWPALGCDDAALWGECKGSGAKPYQVEVDLSGPAFKCTCPSRKFPCKHALALLLLRLQHESAFTQHEAPEWVKEWLAARGRNAARQGKKSPGQPPDPAASARREASRLKRMAAGLDDLERWMCDLVRHGFGQLSGASSRWAEDMAARMVDAQVPGMAARLRALSGVVGTRPDWPALLLAGFGRMQLLIDAFRRLDALPLPEGADVRAALGLVPDKEEVLAEGERAEGRWLVLGVGYDEEDRLWRRRVWLYNLESARPALLLDFSHREKRFEHSYVPGSVVRLALAFYPGASPLRAVALEAPAADGTAPVPSVTLAEALEAVAGRVAAQPWQWPLPMMISDASPCREGEAWRLQSDDGSCLPLFVEDDDGWQLLALAGGHPLSLWGEWDGACFRPLSAWLPGASGAPLWLEGGRG